MAHTFYDLSEGQLTVNTRFSIESGDNNSNSFCLKDYSTLAEFFIDCASWFSDEENPEYVYSDWENIPESMISERWISPNLFELRDALQTLDQSLHAYFWHWCKSFGWEPATDEPYKLVSDFESSMTGKPSFDTSECCPEEDEQYMYMVDHTGGSFELFDDNYN